MKIYKNNFKHGETNKTKEYRAWSHMKARCYNVNDQDYYNYGSRGIKVCDRWLNSFENFLKDMGRAPTQEYSIDRVDSNGNYCPDNCRWATNKEQSRNRNDNIIISYNGKSLCLKDWAGEIRVPYETLRSRVKAGFMVEKILSPSRLRRRKIIKGK